MKRNREGWLSEEKAKDDLDTYLKSAFTRRVLLSATLVLAGMGALFARMFHLQIGQHDYYRTRAQSNRIRIKPLVPERGTIYDAKGIALTENILRYRVVVNPSVSGKPQALLSQVLPVLFLSEVEQQDFLKRFQASRRYESVVLKASLTEDEHYQLAVQLYQLPGVEIEPYYERYYPYGALSAHLLGYTNRISEKDLEQINPEEYHGIDVIGRSGIEKQYEDRLRGKPGFQQVETDANGNLVRVLSEVPAERGQDVYLHLDLALQRYIYQVMGEYRGSCVVLDPQSGGVLAMVSKPGFDSNLFTRGISQRQYQNLLDDPHGPLYDRALKGRYSPGSVIKPMLLMAGLHFGNIDRNSTTYCGGYYRIPDSSSSRRFHCWKRHGHGRLNGHKAVAESCDIYFYSLGYQMGINRMHEYGQQFCISKPTGIDLPDEGSGIMPDQEWKQLNYKTNWYIGDTINASIGQGFVTTTPLQLAYMTAMIARDGKGFSPRLLKQVYDPVAMTFRLPEAAPEPPLPYYQPQYWQQAREAMEAVIHAPYGTGRGISSGLRYRMAGKSGTVQVISFKNDKRIANEHLAKEHQDNAMFIAYAPADAPKIAISMVVERGGGGSSTAGPLVRKISDFYLLPESRVVHG